MTTLSHRANAFNTGQDRKASILLQHLRRSRSIASMLPWLLLSGVMTLAVSAFMHTPWVDAASGSQSFLGAWMESWLIAWPIAFPVAYVAGPMLMRFAAMFSAPAEHMNARKPGLGFGDIQDASVRATAKNGLTVLRNMKRTDASLRKT